MPRIFENRKKIAIANFYANYFAVNEDGPDRASANSCSGRHRRELRPNPQARKSTQKNSTPDRPQKPPIPSERGGESPQARAQSLSQSAAKSSLLLIVEP